MSIIILIYVLLAIYGAVKAGANIQQELTFRDLLYPEFLALPICIGLRLGSALWWRVAVAFSGIVFIISLLSLLLVWLVMTPPRFDLLGLPNVSEKILKIELGSMVSLFGVQLLLLFGPVVRGRFKCLGHKEKTLPAHEPPRG